MELKKGVSPEPDEDDVKKLQAYRHPKQLNYSFALFLRLGVRAHAGTVSCIAWV
jgi:hypothetical protein